MKFLKIKYRNTHMNYMTGCTREKKFLEIYIDSVKMKE